MTVDVVEVAADLIGLQYLAVGRTGVPREDEVGFGDIRHIERQLLDVSQQREILSGKCSLRFPIEERGDRFGALLSSAQKRAGILRMMSEAVRAVVQDTGIRPHGLEEPLR